MIDLDQPLGFRTLDAKDMRKADTRVWHRALARVRVKTVDAGACQFDQKLAGPNLGRRHVLVG